MIGHAHSPDRHWAFDDRPTALVRMAQRGFQSEVSEGVGVRHSLCVRALQARLSFEVAFGPVGGPSAVGASGRSSA